MDQFQSLLPHGKSVNCLDDLGSLSVKELKNILIDHSRIIISVTDKMELNKTHAWNLSCF